MATPADEMKRRLGLTSRRKKRLTLFMIFLLLAVILLGILALTRCTQDSVDPELTDLSLTGTTTDSSTGVTTAGSSAGTLEVTPPPDPFDAVSAAMVDSDSIDPRQNTGNGLPQSSCFLAAHLLVADGPGKPLADAQASLAEPDMIPLAANHSDIGIIRPLPTLPIIIIPIPTPAPSSKIQVLNPDPATILTAGSSFELRWTIDSGRDPTIDILLSTDSGQSYLEIAKGIANTSSFLLTVPQNLSTNCHFRVNAWVGTILLGYNLSPTFAIAAPVAPTAKPTAKPTPKPTAKPTAKPTPKPTAKPTAKPAATPLATPTAWPSPSSEPTSWPTPPVQKLPIYIADDSPFISADGDATRWFLIDHDLASVNKTIWQVSRTAFPCAAGEPLDDSALANPPGLVAQGQLTAGVFEFAIDFSALIKRLEEKPAETGVIEPPVNHGNDFEIVAEQLMAHQAQRTLYLRAILLDEQGRVAGITQSDFQLVYGHAAIKLPVAGVDPATPDIPAPVLEVKTEAGFEPGSYEPLAENPLAIYAGGNTDWSFMLEGIPVESVEIDLQIATVPFASSSPTDFQTPDGLVYQSEKKGLTYTTVTAYYDISFSDFAPNQIQLGENTLYYYLRAVCHVPGSVAGTVNPVASLTARIIYSGDLAVILANSFEPPTLPPEEVEVASFVPSTDFLRYIPVQWALPDDDEYFEVTRPIQAEEICFYIKNNKTGDFLYPYQTHMFMYPNTSREEYQAIVDRMLPPGAWFHLTITQSGWDAFWSDFFDLLGQIYASIQKAYNDFKVTVANTVADRFAFLGSDIQSLVRTAVTALVDYGLASVGLPPSLPNFEQLADEGLDYCVRVALDEAAKTAGVPVDELPAEVRLNIASEMKNQLDSLAEMKHVNPLDVDYLKPAVGAMYRPAYVDVKVMNPHHQNSPAGTLTLSYYPVGKPHFKMYEYTCLPIPSLAPGESTFIRVFLKPDNTDMPVYKDYYWGDTGECIFQLTAEYDVPDVNVAAVQQGVVGINPLSTDVFVYDRDPVFTQETLSPPCNAFYN